LTETSSGDGPALEEKQVADKNDWLVELMVSERKRATAQVESPACSSRVEGKNALQSRLYSGGWFRFLTPSASLLK